MVNDKVEIGNADVGKDMDDKASEYFNGIKAKLGEIADFYVQDCPPAKFSMLAKMDTEHIEAYLANDNGELLREMKEWYELQYHICVDDGYLDTSEIYREKLATINEFYMYADVYGGNKENVIKRQVENYVAKVIILNLSFRSQGIKKVEKKSVTVENFKDLLKASFLDIESDTTISTDEKINMVIHTVSVVCATIAIQPIPFADAIILTPIQMLMIAQLTRIIVNDAYKKEYIAYKDSDYHIKKINSSEILTIIAASCGAGVLVQQGIIGLYKTVIPFLGAVTTIPMVYGATYAIGKTAQRIIEKRIKGEQIGKDEIRKTYKNVVKEKESEVKKHKDYSQFLKEENSKLENKINELEKHNSKMQELYNKAKEQAENNDSATKLLTESNKIRDAIYALIDGAEKNIYISIFDISEYTVLDKLIGRSSENINIKILTDYRKVNALFNNRGINGSGNRGYGADTVNRVLKCFEQKNVEVKVWGRNKGGIMHKKEIIVDGSQFLLGSANLTRSAINNNEESVILSKDIRMAREATVSFFKVYNLPETELFNRNNF